MTKEDTPEEIRENVLVKEVEEGFDRLDEYIKLMRKKSQKQWISGYVAGYGSAIVGMAIGVAFVKFINRKKKTG